MLVMSCICTTSRMSQWRRAFYRNFCIKFLGDIAEKYFRLKYEAMVKSSEQHAKHQAIGEREKEEWVKLLASFAKCSHTIADKT